MVSLVYFLLNKESYVLIGGSCFPSVANVILDNGKTIHLSELKIGDRVDL